MHILYSRINFLFETLPIWNGETEPRTQHIVLSQKIILISKLTNILLILLIFKITLPYPLNADINNEVLNYKWSMIVAYLDKWYHL